ncbi:MAG: molybdopterin dehydrogenase FAD-binding protein [Paenibacillus sp.]|jgi:carbon-monoxide dehydrogenase medium subunit|nr:molybdopterin dehydrogenase FAD-binding protein [Paenibacillus sp.]
MAVGLYPHPDFHRQVWQPRTLLEAWQLKQRFANQAVYVSGGTLLRIQWESGTALMPPHLISLESLPELRRIQEDDRDIRIGSAVTLAACLRDIHTPALLKEACRNIAAPSIRNTGTLGGNIMSAAGDSLPALLASDARLVWYDGQGTVVQTASDWVQQKRLDSSWKEQRLLIGVKIPKKQDTIRHFYEKLGRREAFCPSVVTIAGALQKDTDGRMVGIRLAAGSAAAAAERLTDAENLLEGQRLSAELIQHIHPLIVKQFDGGSDAFASGEYRRQAAANMIAAALWSLVSD